MNDFRTAIRAIAIIAFTIGGLLVPYFLAYRFTGTRSVQATEEVQVYRQPWQADLFSPAANSESFIRKKNIHTAYVVYAD